MTKVLKCVLIGEDNLVLECANILLILGHNILGLISPTTHAKSWANNRGIFIFNSMKEAEERLDLYDCDYLFSIVNSSIIPSSLLAKIRCFAINYHDAFLPRYAGVHAIPWAIINNEKCHGITWHVISQNIDFGDILYQKEIEIDRKDTTVSLSLKCYQEAIKSFSMVVDQLTNGSFSLVKQDLDKRLYFSRKAKPFANGVINWFSDAESIERMCRALDFGNYPNQFSLPKLLLENNLFFTKSVQIEKTKTDASQGTVVFVSSYKFIVTTSSYDLSIKELYDKDGKILSIDDLIEKYFLNVGYKLPTLSNQLATKLVTLGEHYAQYEKFWLNKFDHVNKVRLPFFETAHHNILNVPDFFQIHIDKQNCEILKKIYIDQSFAIVLFSVITILINRLTDNAFNSVKLRNIEIISSVFENDAFFNDYVPIILDLNPQMPFAFVVDRFIEELGSCADKRFSSDIFLRYGLGKENEYFPISFNVIGNIEKWHPSSNDMLSFVIDENEQLYMVTNQGTGLKWTTAYDKKVFCEHLNILLGSICLNSSKTLEEHTIFSDHEHNQVINSWNSTEATISKIDSIIELFEKQAEQTPNYIALSYQSKKMNYVDLNSKVNRLARYLIKSGVNSESFVIIGVERSFDMIISLLAVLKSGAVYIPIDLSNPQKRIQHIIADSQANFLITQSKSINHLGRFLGKTILLDKEALLINKQPDENLNKKISSNQLAYVIYTSGSTGYPKGVMIEHGSLINYLLWCKKTYHVKGHGKVLLHSSIAFDMAITSVYLPLITGDEIILLPDSLDVEPLIAELKKADTYKFLKLTPAHLHAFRASLTPAQLQSKTSILIIGGENLYSKDIEFWREADPLVTIYNEYGPTEATVGCCVYQITQQYSEFRSIPIGVAIDNTQLYVLDSKHQPLPIGVEGELYIGGLSLARGYLNKEELTQEKFINNPFVSTLKARLYKTGDKVYYTRDGLLNYVDRTDNQIKIRGYRIELGEIESILNTHADIYQAVVVASKDSFSAYHLVAYLVAGEFMPSSAELRQYLLERLPEYMIPIRFMFLSQMPLTANGKLDRQALPDISLEDGETKFIPPTSDFEKELSEIWCDLFKLDKISITANFFQIGGDSIVSLQLVSKAREKNIILKFNQIFQFPTIAELATVAKLGSTDQKIQIKGSVDTDRFSLSPIQHWFFEQNLAEPNYFNQSIVLKTYTKIKVDLLEHAFMFLMKKHDALRLRFIQKEGTWLQYVVNFDTAVTQQTPLCHVISIKENESSEIVEKHCSNFHKKFDIQEGPTFKAIIFNHENQDAQSIVLMAHHLIIDGVSWRIIAQDLEDIYRCLADNKEIVLSEEGTSYKKWIIELEKHGMSDEIQEEKQYWQNTLTKSKNCLENIHAHSSIYTDFRNISVFLDDNYTQLLLQKTNRAYNTQINDILLTAFYLTLSQWTRSNAISLVLEGHGREIINQDLDLSRTVGWFTALYPVYLETNFSEKSTSELHLKSIIKSVKEQLRGIPRKGVSFGILQYLVSDKHHSLTRFDLPNICFNYMGQWGTLKHSENIFLIDSHINNAVGSKNSLPFQLSINCQILNGVMQIDWQYDASSYQEIIVSELADSLLVNLKKIIDHCISVKQYVHTASDFPLSSLTQETFEQVFHDAELIEDIYPLSPMQEGLLFHKLSYPESDAYFEQNVYYIKSTEFNYDLLRQAWNLVANHHSCLRSGIAWKNLSKPLQYILRNVEVPWIYTDISATSEEERQKLLNDYLLKDRCCSFDFSNPPYFRISVLKLSETEFNLIWSHHHIILDGWSVGLVLDQVLTSYTQLCKGETPYLSYVTSYREFIHSLSSQNQDLTRDFWQKKMSALYIPSRLSDYPLHFSKNKHVTSDIQLITPHQHGEHVSFDYGVFHSTLSERLTNDLTLFAEKNALTLNTLIQGAWSILLHQYLDSINIVYGITFAGRHIQLPQIEKIPGLFINTLPLIQEINPDQSLISYLHSLQKHILELMQYDAISLSEIQAMSPDAKSMPLFDCIVAFENFPSFENFNNKDFQFKYISVLERTEYPLTINIFPNNEIYIRYGFQTSSFDHEGISTLNTHLGHILSQMVQYPENHIKNFSLLTKEEHTFLQQKFWMETPFPKDKTIHGLFQEQAMKTPNKLALKYESERLSYCDLEKKSNQLATYLRNRGVGKGLVVAVCLEPSIQQIICLLAVFKAGAAYLPLDPTYPKDRLKFMLKDALANYLVSLEKHDELFSDYCGNVISLDKEKNNIEKEADELLSLDNSANDLAYVIYTSGSTGTPKGVCIPHKNVHRLITATQKWFGFNQKDVWVLFHSYAFDFSVWEIWGALLTGGTLIIVPYFISRSPSDFSHLLEAEKVTVLNQTPTAFSQLLSYQKQSLTHNNFCLRLVIFGGESLNPYILKSWYEAYPDSKISFVNMYGITETTVHVTYYPIDVNNLFASNIIGEKIPDLKLYILNQNQEICPVGVVGELYVGGAGVALGYLNRPELTQKKFIQNPFSCNNEEKIYRTGDKARYRSDGNIEYWGRLDDQVKIRGYRVELGEIESLLISHPDVAQATVCVEDTSKQQNLIAYCVAPKFISSSTTAKTEFNIQLRQFLSQHLPVFMIPSLLVLVDYIPLTFNGKTDRKKLSQMRDDFRSTDVNYIAPNTEMEKNIASIWSSLLNIDQIGTRDNFFDLGGHSLLAMQLLMRINTFFNVNIKMRELFSSPTICECVNLIASYQNNLLSKTENCYELPLIQEQLEHRYESFPLTDIQQAYWMGRNGFYELGKVAVQTYHEYDFLDLNIDILEKAWNKLILRHESLRLVFNEDGTQQILNHVPYYKFGFYDLRELSQENTEAKLISIRNELSHKILPSNEWPLFSIHVSILQNKIRLHTAFDALILDAWSLRILLKEWVIFFEDTNKELDTLKVSFRDYVNTESLIKENVLYQRDKTYWSDRIRNLPLAPRLPLNIQPQNLDKQVFLRYSKCFPKNQWLLIEAYLKRNQLSASVLLAGLFGEVLSVWSGSRNFALNITLFNRLPLHPDINKITGDFSSILLLEFNIDSHISFLERIKNVQRQLFQDLDYRLFSGVEVLRALNKHNSGKSLIYMPIVFTCTIGKDENDNEFLSPNQFFSNEVFSITQTPQVWLDYKTYLHNNGDLVIEWDYIADLFPAGMIEEMHDAYYHFLQQLANNELSWLETDIKLLPMRQVENYKKFNQTHWTINSGLLHDLFNFRANLSPEKMAVIDSTQTINYRNLQNRSYQLGRYLLSLEAKPNQLIAVIMHKSIEQIIALLGILNSGSAYLPIDPDLPEDRIKSLLIEGKAKIILTQSEWLSKLKKIKSETLIKHILPLNNSIADNLSDFSMEPFPSQQNMSDLAYVIFTSGSTGVPKGVMIDHAGVVNTILDINDRFKVTNNDSILSLSNLNFDLSVYDIFGLLIAGGTVIFPNQDDLRNPKAWLKLIEQYGITIWNTVPMFMQMFVEYINKSVFTKLRLILLSGDWIPLELPKQIQQKFLIQQSQSLDIVSLGGATEASIWSVIYPVKNVSSFWNSIPYGTPLRNQQLYVLNDSYQQCPEWVPGNLYIGGLGLAKGYWNNQDKTKDSFVINPHSGQKLYKTGDLARHLPEGYIEFLGRNDSQIKKDGHRIELGEIETALKNHARIQYAFIEKVGEAHNTQLVAYVKIGGNRNHDAIIKDEAHRLEFKLSRHNIRHFPKNHPTLFLSKSSDAIENIIAKYYQRKSYREFKGKNLTYLSLYNWIETAFQNKNRDAHQNNLSLQALLSEILKPLSSVKEETLPLPKYQYPSAGSLYPIQVYVEIFATPQDDIVSGFYYYDSTGHNLKYVTSTDNHINLITKETIINLYFIAKLSAIAPLYHGLSESFCALETGYMMGLLNGAPGSYRLDKQNNEINLSSYLNLSDTDKLIQKISLCSSLDGCQKPLFDQFYEITPIHIFVYIKNAMQGAEIGWYEYSLSDKKLLCRTDLDNFAIISESNESSVIYNAASFAILFMTQEIDDEVKKMITQLQAGMLSESLMMMGVDLQIGVCPIGNLEHEELLNLSKVIEGKHFIHGLLGGAILPEQIQEIGDSNIKSETLSTESLKAYLSPLLPNYMIPNHFIMLKEIPLSANGKVDRNLLPRVNFLKTKKLIHPKSVIEKHIAQIWKELLQLDEVSIDTNFFELGGNSLTVIQVMMRLKKHYNVELSLKLMFECPSVYQLSIKLTEQLSTRNTNVLPPIVPILPFSGEATASFQQKRLWFMEKLADKLALYNVPIALQIEGPLNQAYLQTAINTIVRRHQIFLTNYIDTQGELRQIINPNKKFPITLIEENSQEKTFSNEEYYKEAFNRIKILIKRPFDLEHDNLIKFYVFKLSESKYIFLSVVHHLIVDGWSVHVFIDELKELYNAQLEQREANIPNLSVQYYDYAIWQRMWINDGILDKQLEYWKHQLQDVTEALNLPIEHKRPKETNYAGAIHTMHMGKKLADDLKCLGEKNNTSLFTVLLTAFSVLLYKYTGQNDVVIGTPVAGRKNVEVERLIGFFINTLVIRTTHEDSLSFVDLLAKINKTVFDAYENQDVPFEQIVDSLQVTRDLSRNPIFQAWFVLHSWSDKKNDFSGLSSTLLNIDTGVAKFDIALLVTELESGLQFSFEYATGIFSKVYIADFSERFCQLLLSILKDSDCNIQYLQFLTERDKESLFAWHMSEKFSYDKEIVVQKLFETQVMKYSKNLALSTEHGVMTYDEMNIKANQLAHYLRNKNVEKNSLVAIFLDHKSDFMISILAILKTGGAYLPLDPAYPETRIQFMIEDANPHFLITTSTLESKFKHYDGTVVLIDTDKSMIERCQSKNIKIINDINDLAYIIYTSGSTGRPKGVLVKHKNLMSSLMSRIKYYTEPVENFMLLSSVAFDSSVAGIFWTLCTGGCLHLSNINSEIDVEGVATQIVHKKISHLLCIPSLYSLLLEQIQNNLDIHLKTAIVAGEKCDEQLVTQHQNFLPGTDLFNEYGPTEATVWSSVKHLYNSLEKKINNVCIGRPIPNAALYILDSALQLVPMGVEGELYIAGPNVSDGYLNHKKLTEEKFIQNPFNTDIEYMKIYKTGDRVKYLANGDIQFLGRVDEQVKIRGYRIELGEIEFVLNEHQDIKQAIVLNNHNQLSTHLVAYIVCGEFKPSDVEIKQYLAQKLPSFMIPSTIFFLEKFPITANGKLDKKLLPNPAIERNKQVVAPITETEKQLAAIWSELLGVQNISIVDNFFNVGGDSLLATRVVLLIRAEIKKNVPLLRLFEYPILQDLAAYLDMSSESEAVIYPRIKRRRSNTNEQETSK